MEENKKRSIGQEYYDEMVRELDALGDITPFLDIDSKFDDVIRKYDVKLYTEFAKQIRFYYDELVKAFPPETHGDFVERLILSQLQGKYLPTSHDTAARLMSPIANIIMYKLQQKNAYTPAGDR